MYKLGCLKDKHDDRDLKLKSYLIPQRLPKSVNWFDYSIPVPNQGNEPSCVGYSGANLKKSQELIETGKILEISGSDLYKKCKEKDGEPEQPGTYIRTLMDVLQEEGAKDAENNYYKIKAYTRVENIDELKYAIAANGFALIGVKVFQNFYSPVNGKIDYNEAFTFEGGHCILAGAYDDYEEVILFKNWWGEEWGINGYGYMTYKYFQNALDDCWTSIDTENTEKIAGSLFNIGKLKSDLDSLKSL